jgi:cytoskeleton protein RodZ
LLPADAGAPTPIRQAAEVPVPANALHLRFAEESWVEIRDRSGQIVSSQLNAAGSEHVVKGQPPFALVVGNATHVTVRYKGRLIDLQPRSKDDVARVTVE